MSWCDKEQDHEREGRRDFERKGRYGMDRELYRERYYDDCAKAYVRGFDEVTLALVRNEGRDVADDRRIVGKEEGFVDVHLGRRDHVADVDPFMDGDRPLLGHAVGDEHLPDRFGCGDEAVDLTVFPA